MTEREFTEIYESQARKVLAGVLRLVHNEAVAEELMQETFLQFLKTAESANIASVKGLLFRISHNLAVDFIRKDQRVDSHSDTDAIAAGKSGDNEMEYRVLRQSILDRIRKEDPRLLEFYILTVDYALHIDEIAAELKISRRSAFRLRDQLKSLLAEFL
jgi:DNA-directed RNA polymerase specialized sigma24 family protein